MSPMTLQSLVVRVTEGEERAVDADRNTDRHLHFFFNRTDADNRLTKSYKLWSYSELKEFTMILHMDQVKI